MRGGYNLWLQAISLPNISHIYSCDWRYILRTSVNSRKEVSTIPALENRSPSPSLCIIISNRTMFARFGLYISSKIIITPSRSPVWFRYVTATQFNSQRSLHSRTYIQANEPICTSIGYIFTSHRMLTCPGSSRASVPRTRFADVSRRHAADGTICRILFGSSGVNREMRRHC